MGNPTLKPNDQGAAVAEAQDLLNRAGAILDEDGKFGGATVTAVREFRTRHGLSDVPLVDDPLWNLLRALPIPNADIPTRAVAFIGQEEVGGRDFYDRFCTAPTWPGDASGVTIGVGYDLGYQSDFVKDWSGLLPDSAIARLMPWVGITGTAAGAGLAQLVDIAVPWQAAWGGYIERTLPQEVTKTQGVFIASPARPLPRLCLGVLVSLVYNRGTAMTDNSVDDRRLEMRQIRDALAAKAYEDIPQLIRNMRRLWPAGNGLRGRRDREAELFEVGLG